MPKLILQPLVENAIVHGIEPKIGNGIIKITARCEGKDMLIEVWDDGVGFTEEQLKNSMENEGVSAKKSSYEHTKVGLMAVHKRVRILYGEDYGITIKSAPDDGTCITIKLPIKFEDEVENDEI